MELSTLKLEQTRFVQEWRVELKSLSARLGWRMSERAEWRGLESDIIIENKPPKQR